MTASRIVTPEEAGLVIGEGVPDMIRHDALLYTVATEPDRTRAAVVKALRDEADMLERRGWVAAARYQRSHADQTANGADW